MISRAASCSFANRLVIVDADDGDFFGHGDAGFGGGEKHAFADGVVDGEDAAGFRQSAKPGAQAFLQGDFVFFFEGRGVEDVGPGAVQGDDVGERDALLLAPIGAVEPAHEGEVVQVQ